MRNVGGREQLSPRPCHLGRPVIGGRAVTWPRGWSGRKRAPFQGEAEAAEVRVAPRSVSASDPRRQFGRSLRLCSEWRRDGARGERRQRGVGRAPTADPQPEACATGGQRDPVPQLHFSLLLPRYRPRPVPRLRTVRLGVAARQGGAPSPTGERASERAGGWPLRPAVPPSRGYFPLGRRFPLSRRGAGEYGPSPVASSPALRASHCDPALGARAVGAAGVDWSVEGARRPLGLILLLEFPDAPGSDWDSKEPRKRSPLLVWGARRLTPAVRPAARLSGALAARTPNRPRRAEGPNAALRLRRGLVSPGPRHPQVVCGSLAPASKCAHSASFSF